MTRPLVYYWVAEYSDGEELLQFDKVTLKENRFDDINQDKIVKFTLKPFEKNYAKDLYGNGHPVVSIEFLPTHKLNLNKEERLIYYRQVFISSIEISKCKDCNKEFIIDSNTKFKPYKIKDNKLGVRVTESSPICTHCGSSDCYICEKCKERYDTYNDTNECKCVKCGGRAPRVKITSESTVKEKRWIHYYIGKQKTENGKNIKQLMRIYENGETEIL